MSTIDPLLATVAIIRVAAILGCLFIAWKLRDRWLTVAIVAASLYVPFVAAGHAGLPIPHLAMYVATVATWTGPTLLFIALLNRYRERLADARARQVALVVRRLREHRREVAP